MAVSIRFVTWSVSVTSAEIATALRSSDLTSSATSSMGPVPAGCDYDVGSRAGHCHGHFTSESSAATCDNDTFCLQG